MVARKRDTKVEAIASRKRDVIYLERGAVSARRLIGAKEVAEQLGTSKAYAHKVIRKLNDELQDGRYVTVAGKVSAEYFERRFFSTDQEGSGREDGR